VKNLNALFCVGVLVAASLCVSTATAQTIKGSGGVGISVSSTWHPTNCVRYSFTPNDPFYLSNSTSGYTGQWHLDDQTSADLPDVNITGAWNRDLTGLGVTIGIVDDCLQINHPDLASNYDAADSWDFGQNDSNPSPVYTSDMHGTSVAGVAAARGGNGIGVTGAAPYAGLAGLRIDFNSQTDAMFVNATLYHSSGTNTSIAVKNHSYGVSVPFMSSTAQVNALNTSAAAGTMHCVAAGNERAYHGSYYYDTNGSGSFEADIDYAVDGDANKKALQSSTSAICVAALGADGKFAYYSNWGANVFVTAPSSGISGYGITTTDRTGSSGYNTDGSSGELSDTNYTNTFGGTSSATPLVSGILALGKQANPNMNERMAKHLLARTSKVVDATDSTAHGGWTTNAAGLHFNQNYGFGLIDADAFTAMAAQVSSLTPLTTTSTGTINVAAAIPDNNTTGISRTFTVSNTQKLEDVQVHLEIDHTWRGDLEAILTSPSGTTCNFMSSNALDSFDTISWTFDINTFWGESPYGTWTLTVHDIYSGDTGTWESYWVTANMGDIVLVPEPGTIALVLTAILPAIGLMIARRRRKV
jgi:subtilisin-like proprotein convertase family protein